VTIVVLTGPPGSGKGTQAELLAERLGIPVISTGEIFRAQVTAGTDLGRQAQQYLDSGEYVPSEVTNEMVRERLAAEDTNRGFLIDGYPRTLDQVAVLDDVLAGKERELHGVVVLEVPIDELVRRMLHRAGVEHRSDDTEDVIRKRLRVYEQQTIPLIEEYAARGLVIPVDGTGDPDQVSLRIADLAEVLRQRGAESGTTHRGDVKATESGQD